VNSPTSHQAPGRYLRSSVVWQPLVHRWPAWPQLIPPHTAALNLRDRLLPVLRSYLKAPRIHAESLRSPAMYSGPFIDDRGRDPADYQGLLDRILTDAVPLLQLADDLDRVRVLLREQADGRALTGLHARLPDSLRGRAELVYDASDHPRLRLFEPLLYRAFEQCGAGQSVSLLPAPDPRRPFALSNPVLPGPGQLDLPLRFADGRLDALAAARYGPVRVPELADILAVPTEHQEFFASLFTDSRPESAGGRVATGTVRMRYFGHACVLVQSEAAAVLLDPVPGYSGDGDQHFTLADLPEGLDAIVLSHGHPDHVNVEALLQLRERTGIVVVPESSAGDLADPDLASLLNALGFPRIRRLGCMEDYTFGPDASVIALPFTGEHADLDIRAKMVPLVTIGGRRLMFATDTAPQVSEFYDQLHAEIGTIDALFIGLECVGAPLTWLYGPLLEAAPTREHDLARRLRGSDATMADRLARQTGARRAYGYAMGIESWLRHFTGSENGPESEQQRQAAAFIQLCANRGVPAQLLRDRGEHVWPALPSR
jgi:L-ascorbate metabolism protein UlaG (beta-lactamase superfamily)